MKRRLIICSSLITIILSCFSFPIFAEETVQDSSTIHTLSDGVFLDQYFYDNYDPLPYIQSDGSQYINTGIIASNYIDVDLTFSDIVGGVSSGLLGISNNNRLFFGFYSGSVPNTFNYSYGYGSASTYFLNVYTYPYQLFRFYNIENTFYLNDVSNSVIENEFTSNYPISVFALTNDNNGSKAQYSSYKLYKLSIYDRSLNDGEGAYVRYYYPAKSKSGGIIGLYDAVNKTFVSSGSNVAFSNPTNEYVENFQISSFLSASLTWIDQIFDAIIDMPIVIIFMAIGLAGAMFRWGRRIVHF